MTHVYHFTDAVHLPWILQSGKLTKGGSTMGDYPKHDFLWATTDTRGARSATLAAAREHYKKGSILLVRVTLHAEDFKPWREAMADTPEWTPELIARLARTGREMGDNPDNWVCHEGDLPRSRWVAIHARSYRNPSLIDIPLDANIVRDGEFLGVTIEGRTLFSRQGLTKDGTTGYEIRLPR